MGIGTFILGVAFVVLFAFTGLLYGVASLVWWLAREAVLFSRRAKQTRQQAIQAHSVTIEAQDDGGYQVVE